MALKQHLDHKVRFDQQVENSRAYVVPFIQETMAIDANTRVLEVGTGEGGVLVPFMDLGATCVGVDLNPERIDLANDFLSKEVAGGKVKFLFQNIYDKGFTDIYTGYFDLIILKDVIEHVPGHQQFIAHLKTLLRPSGQIFFGFPPWHMPFGGHQQVCRTKWVSKLPYYHILPVFIYKAILKAAKEPEPVIKELLEIKETRITIEMFERIVREVNMKVVKKQHYLINPIYKYKFSLNPRKQFPIITMLPYVRNYLTTCVYYTISN